jgi:hypothetical protein
MTEPTFLVRDLSHPQIEFRTDSNDAKIVLSDSACNQVNHISQDESGGLLLGDNVNVTSTGVDIYIRRCEHQQRP